jgi:beta-glucosidase
VWAKRRPVNAAALAYWDVGKQSFVVEPGHVKIMVGSSSADVRLETTIEVKGK